MLHIILTILAIIGIIILCLLGVILLLLLCVLFVPIRYRIKGILNMEEKLISVKVTWFLHILSAAYTYPKPGALIIKLFGFPLKRKKEEGPESPGQDKPIKQDKPITQEVKPEREEETGSEAEDVTKDATNNVGEESGRKDPHVEKPKRRKKRRSIFIKIKAKILSVIQKIRYTIRNIYDKIKEIIENYEYYKNLFLEEENKLFFLRCKDRLEKIIKNIRPYKGKAQLIVGTGSPDTTGYVLALYSMFLPFWGDSIDITPDFEQTILEGEFFLKGRITLFVLLIHAAGLYLDKQFHVFLKKLKREDA